ncbi:MAG: GNAT family N-acetyltransferase [Solirubrobacteraceae bacterium]|jgi:GNAT superfamily N-acetyltransferase|nr:GNAT family N-acetyltransferase [Solirubrobacteraceae bacterium]MDP4673378.1 GNAT family N-acetyltransferase [Solirubrobacteraceae bacterium]MDP4921712.1 GNAT family N-acetyltransferase [Solirubrobacteraceae bacterium]
MANRVRISIGSEDSELVLVDGVVERFAAARKIEPADAQRLGQVVHKLTAWIIEHAYPGDPTGELVVQLELAEGAVRCTIEDWGEPIAAFGGGLGSIPPELAQVEAITHDLRLVNLGRDGKRLSTAVEANGVIPQELVAFSQFARESGESDATADQIEIQNTAAADVEAVSRLLYTNYGLGYGHPNFYQPRWVAEQIESGRLHSSVAMLAGEIVGHHALLLEASDEAGETGVAVVHPAYRGLGIFNRLFEHTLERARTAAVQAVYARAVTGHPYSQRAEHSRGYRESALMLGSVPQGKDESGQPTPRRASLLTFLPLERSPRAVSLPERYADPLTAAYSNLELETVGPERERAIGQLGERLSVQVERDEQRKSSLITVSRWGDEGRAQMLDAVRSVVHHHDDVVYCDLDLETLTTEELDEAVEQLRQFDFFYCGLALCAAAGHDHLRLQALMSDDIELQAIVLDSAYAQALREVVFADRPQA